MELLVCYIPDMGGFSHLHWKNLCLQVKMEFFSNENYMHFLLCAFLKAYAGNKIYCDIHVFNVFFMCAHRWSRTPSMVGDVLLSCNQLIKMLQNFQGLFVLSVCIFKIMHENKFD
jgi:hypothetical protein